MTNVHDRGKKLLDLALLENLSGSERLWLETHLTTCDSCRQHSAATRRSIQAFRSVTVPVGAELVRRTQCKVRLRAQEVERAREQRFAVWLAGGMAAVLTTTTTLIAWPTVDLVGQSTTMPSALLQLAYVCFWLIPSLSAALLLLLGHHLPDTAQTGPFDGGE